MKYLFWSSAGFSLTFKLIRRVGEQQRCLHQLLSNGPHKRQCCFSKSRLGLRFVKKNPLANGYCSKDEGRGTWLKLLLVSSLQCALVCYLRSSDCQGYGIGK